MKRSWLPAVLAALALGHAPAVAASFDLRGQCGTCHALQRPAAPSIERIQTRAGPDLWYAGDKFNAEWLAGWLQGPKPIRPAGYPYFRTIKAGPDHDEPDPALIKPHPALSAADAAAAAQALMLLKGPPELVPRGGFTGDAGGARMGSLAFNKLRGCASCHQGEDAKGGLSGPSLTEAGLRLKPDFIAAYTADPQRIDRYVWMPVIKMNEKDIQRLTAYVAGLKGEAKP